MKERAAVAAGLAPPALIQTAKPGAVYTVKDKAIAFPTERLPNAGTRTLHRVRPVIIMTTRLRCTASQPVTMLVIPCSTSHRGPVGAWDLAVPTTETCFKEPTVAYPSLLQPILKSDLDAYRNDVSPEFLVNLQQVLAAYLALVGAASEDLRTATDAKLA